MGAERCSPGRIASPTPEPDPWPRSCAAPVTPSSATRQLPSACNSVATSGKTAKEASGDDEHDATRLNRLAQVAVVVVLCAILLGCVLGLAIVIGRNEDT